MKSSLRSRPAQLAETHAALERSEYQTIEIGRSRIVLERVIGINIQDRFVDPAGPYVEANQFHAIGRNERAGQLRTHSQGSLPGPANHTYENTIKDFFDLGRATLPRQTPNVANGHCFNWKFPFHTCAFCAMQPHHSSTYRSDNNFSSRLRWRSVETRMNNWVGRRQRISYDVRTSL